MTEAEDRFTEAMLNIDRLAREVAPRYDGRRFRDMVARHGGVETARRLLDLPDDTAGLTLMWEADSLDLTSEYLMTRQEWHELFTDDDRARARERLRSYGFDPDTRLANDD